MKPPCFSRARRVQLLCQQQQGQFTLDTAKAILRDHQGGVCMHGGFETRGSQISRLTAHQGEHWLIKRPFPCQQEYELVALPERVEPECHRSSSSLPRKG